MRIAVFGLGYVGTVTAACLVRDGHHVIGVDTNPEKVGLIARGESPIIEPGVAELLKEAVASGCLLATGDAKTAVAGADVSMICVGTPSTADGEANLNAVFHVCDEIADALAASKQRHLVLLRSTVPPGTTALCRNRITLKAVAGRVTVAFNPEFLREGVAVADYNSPAYTVVGTDNESIESSIREIYQSVRAPVITTTTEVAELVKYVSNAWHAVKIGFANEIGRIARSCEVDGREAMRIACLDTKLNISAAYMQPGFAYGGSCLPKDVRALSAIARSRRVTVPLLNSLAQTNSQQIDLAVADVIAKGPTDVAVLGLAFKPGTDDLRESAAVHMVKRLLGEGCRIRIYDHDVHLARLMGTNLAYIRSSLPHFESLFVETVADALSGVTTAVITYKSPAFVEAVKQRPDLRVVDLAGAFAAPPAVREYRGSGW